MRVINLKKFNSNLVDIKPILIKKNKVLLISTDLTAFQSDGYVNTYLEYDIENEKMNPIKILNDLNRQNKGAMKAGISDSYLYHVSLEKVGIEYDTISVRKLSYKENSAIKIFEFKIYKSEMYKHFKDFSNKFIWVYELENERFILRIDNGLNDNLLEYYFRDLGCNTTVKIDSKFTSRDMRYFGVANDENEQYYIFRTGNFGTVNDRKYSYFNGYEDEYVVDKVVAVRKEEFISTKLSDNQNYMLIDSTNKEQGIDIVWISNNEINYLKESVLRDDVEHNVYNLAKKSRLVRCGKMTGTAPMIVDGNCYYCSYNNKSINILNDDMESIFYLEKSEYNERVEAIYSNYVFVGSVNNPFTRRIYEIESKKCIGEFEGNIFYYCEKEDTLIIC